jgi:acyl-CoA thioester hydrolase
MPARTFDCEIQARFRDINLGGHVDSVEAVRIIDEARIQFLMFAPVHGKGTAGVLHRKPAGIVDLMGSQRVDYLTEMRFVPYSPFLVSLRVSHLGRTSFTVATELRIAIDHPPALVAESTLIFWDKAAQESWAMSKEVRSDLEAFLGDPVPLRSRPD